MLICCDISVHWQVLAFGMIFIGATMSLIAHWPGSTQIGENPLKVVGPLILAVGIIGVIVGIVLVCILNSRERKRFQKQMTTAIISRSYVIVIHVLACC